VDHARQIVAPNGRITLLTVLDIPQYPMYGFYPTPVVVEETDYQTALKNLSPKAREYLEGVAAALRHSNFQVHIETVSGEPATVIVDSAQNLGVDAIVMSTHGRSGISRWLFGSVTQKVLEVAPSVLSYRRSAVREAATDNAARPDASAL
jgi:nucleotide-binding universal stress UspA family protein